MSTMIKTLAGLFIISLLGWVLPRGASPFHVGHASWVNKEPPEILKPWFVSVGCCFDEIVDAHRQANRALLSFSDPKHRPLEIPVPAKSSITSFDHTLAPFLMGAYQLWSIDSGPEGHLEHPNIPPRAVDLSAIQAAAVTPFLFSYENSKRHGKPVIGYRLVFTNRPRAIQAAYAITPASVAKTAPTATSTEYLVRSPPLDPLALAEFRTDTGKLRPLLSGLELYAPTGLAFSQDNERLYIADERPTELVWHELQLKEFCTNEWTYRGVIAHFALAPRQRGFFRGIWVHPSGVIFGSGPGGLYLYKGDGTRVGQIKTPDEVTYVLPANDGKADFLYAAIGERLCRLPLHSDKRITSAAVLRPPCPLPPPVPVRPTQRRPAPPCCCTPSSQQPNKPATVPSTLQP